MAQYDVKIDGEKYSLDPLYGEKAYQEEPQPPFKGKDKDGSDFWQYWTIRSWHGGERQAVMLGEADIANNQYHDAEGLAMDTFGEWSLQPALAQDVAIESASMPMVVTTDGARLILGLSVSPYIKIWYNGSWADATAVAGTGAVTDLIAAGTTLYAVRGGAVLKSINNGANWTDVQYRPQQVGTITVTSQGSGYTSAPTVVFECDEGATAPTAHAHITDDKVTSIDIDTKGSDFVNAPLIRLTGGAGVGAGAIAALELGTLASFTTATAVADLNGHVCVGKSSGGVYNQTHSTPISTTGAVTSMASYQGNLYWIEDRRLWCFSGQVPFVYDELPSGFNGALLMNYRTALFILGWYCEQGGYRGAVHFLQNGSENAMYTVGNYAADHRLYAACGGDDEVWFINPDRGGADRFDWTYGGLTCGPAWGSYSGIPFKSVAYVDGYFFIGRHDVQRSGSCQATGNDTTHTKLDSGASAVNDAYNGMLLAHTGGTGIGQAAAITDYDGTTKIATHSTVTTPADATTTFTVGKGTNGVWKTNLANPSAWGTSGWWTSSEWDFDFPNDAKLLGSISVYHRALVAGQSHLVEYSLNGGTTWVTAGTSDTVGATNESYTFGAVQFDSLKVRVTTTGPGTSNPKGKKVLVRACAVSQAKWRWTMYFLADRVASNSGRQRAGYQALANLKTLIDAQKTVTFEDRDGNTHTVIVEDAKITRDARSRRRAFLMVMVREV